MHFTSILWTYFIIKITYPGKYLLLWVVIFPDDPKSEYLKCRETYTKTTNAASSGGILQPIDINTVARCADRCWGYAIGTEHRCHGFDVHKDTNRCMIYVSGNFNIQHTPNVDNYRRNWKCPLPYWMAWELTSINKAMFCFYGCTLHCKA